MKKLVLFFAICSALTTSAQNIPSYVPSNGLVAWYPFNGNANDESGNGNNGTVYGATLTTDRDGNANSAYDFDGSSQDISSSLPTFSNQLSISVWIIPDTISSGTHLRIMNTSMGTGASDRWLLALAPTSENGTIQFGLQKGGIIETLNGTNSISLNIWSHVALTFDSGVVKIYINGILDGSDSFNEQSLNHIVTSTFFGSTNSHNSFFDGKIDDIAIYNRALSPSEIQSLYIGNQPTASINSRGCVECDSLNIGEEFVLNGDSMVVVDRPMLDSMIAGGHDVTKACVSHVTNMNTLFWYSNFNQDISGWDVSNVTKMRSMFLNTHSFNQDIGNWDVSSVTNMSTMFFWAYSFNQDIGNWDVSSVTDMRLMFSRNGAFNKDIGSWDVSSVRDMRSMFYWANSFNQDLSNWCVSQIPSKPGSFSYNSALTTANLPKWGYCPLDIGTTQSLVTGAFVNSDSCIDCSALSVGDYFELNGDTMLVVDRSMLDSMLLEYKDMSKVCVSHITNMKDVFRGRTQFNDDITAWDISNVTDMTNMFFKAKSFNQDIGNWDVSKVIKMPRMFQAAKVFNQDIGSWDVGNVERFQAMFRNADAFNQDLGYWNVSSVLNDVQMQSMFRSADNFSQDLTNWCVSSIASKPTGFDANSPLTTSQLPLWGGCPPPASNLGTDTLSICGQDSVLINARSGFDTYAWNTGETSSSIWVSQSGMYSVASTMSGQYTLDSSVYVSLVDASITASDSVVCAGDSVALSVGNGASPITNSTFSSNLPSYLPTNGLVHFFPLNGSIIDLVGGINGNEIGSTYSIDRNGTPYSAVSLDGNDHIVLDNTFYGGNAINELSYNVWVKIPFYHDGRISGKEGFWKTISLNVSSDGGVSFGGSSSNTYFGISSPSAVLNTNQWHMVTVSLVGGILRLYVDGVEVSSGTCNASYLQYQFHAAGNSTATNYLGAIHPVSTGVTNYLTGEIDDFGLWNRALTPSEIQSLYTAQPSSKLTYNWSTGDTTASITANPTQTTTYYCTVSDGITSCTDSLTVYVNNTLSLDLGPDTLSVCGQDSVLLDAGAGYSSYAWSNGDSTQSITVNSSGMYSCTVGGGTCTATDSVYVSIVNASITVSDSVVCAGDSIQLTVSSNVDTIEVVGSIPYKPLNTSGIYVSNNGSDINGNGTLSNPYKTIQFGITASSNGQAVNILPGAYTGIGNTNLTMQGKSIVIQSTDGPGQTIIDGLGNTNGFLLNSGETMNSRIRGLTIQNCIQTTKIGSAIFVEDNSGISISKCIFKYNGLGPSGTYASVIRFGDTETSGPQSAVDSCIFFQNSSALISSSKKSWYARYCLFEGNTFDGQFIGNGHDAGNDQDISHCVFRDNHSYSSTIIGLGHAKLLNECFFIDNTCDNKGIVYMGTVWSGTNVIDHCTFYNNSGSVYNSSWYDHVGQVKNSVFYGSTGPETVSGKQASIPFSYCNGNNLSGTGNFQGDPLFVDASANNFTYLPGSPCINTSSNGGDVGANGTTLQSWIWNYAPLSTPPNNSGLTLSYNWSTGDTTASITANPTQNTTYYCTVSDGITSCTDSVTVYVNSPVVDLGADTLSVCGQDSVLLDAGAGYSSYAWSNGDSTQSITVNSSGMYSCTVGGGTCTATDSVYVSIINASIIASDSVICAGDSVTLSAGNGASSLFNSASSSNLPSYLPSNGLVAWYPFNGNANDESGNGNNGTVYGATLTTDRDGNANSAYNFNVSANGGWGSAQQRIVVTNPSIPNNNQFSMSAWVKLNTKPSSFANRPHTIMGRWDGNGAKQFRTQINYSGNISTNLQHGSTSTTVVSGNISYGNWQHVVISYDGSILRHFQNGIVVGEDTLNIQINPSTTDLTIGELHMGNGHWYLFSGDMDELGYWNRALTPSEIQALYTTQPPSNLSYNWSTGDTTASITANPTQTTTYYCTVSDGITSCTDSVEIKVGLMDNPADVTVDLAITDTASFSVNYLDSSTSYQWQLNSPLGWTNLLDSSSFYVGGKSHLLKLRNIGTNFNGLEFRCIVTSPSCSEVSDSAVLTVIGVGAMVSNPISLNEAVSQFIGESNLTPIELPVSIRPNPTTGIFYVNPFIEGTYSLIDSKGRTVESGRATPSYDLSSYPNGVYILRLTLETSTHQIRVIKQ